MSGSQIWKNFDSPIGYKGSYELGKDPKVFSVPNTAILPGSVLPKRSLQKVTEHAIPAEYESTVEEQIFHLQETHLSSRQPIPNNIRAALNAINVSDNLSSRYVAMEGLAVATLCNTDVVTNSYWYLQYGADTILALIHQWERCIVELINKNDTLTKENSSLESYI